MLQPAHVGAQVGDEPREGLRAAFGLRGMDLVPQVPGEQGPRPAPPLDHEAQPPLDRDADFGRQQRARGAVQRTAVRDRVRVVAEMEPHPEGVEGREQDAQAVRFAQGEEVVPEPDHVGCERSGGPLDVAMPNLRVFQHQAEAGDALGSQPGQMGVDRRHVAAAEQGIEFHPGDRVVLPDRGPGLPRLGPEVGRRGCDLNPWQAPDLLPRLDLGESIGLDG